MTIITHAEYPEDYSVIAEMRPMLLSGKGLLTTPEAREAFDGIMGQVPGAQGVTYETASVGSVPGWWVRPEGAKGNAVLLYLHGGAFEPSRSAGVLARHRRRRRNEDHRAARSRGGELS